MMHRKRVLVVTGGGTAGHVFPALAVLAHFADAQRSQQIVWIGSKSGIERTLVQQYDIPYYAVACGKLRRYFSLRNIIDIGLVIIGIVSAVFRLWQCSATLVFSKGGFVSVPVVIAAALLRIPIISHESDFAPGLATKINSRFSKKICISHPWCMQFYRPKLHHKLIVTGNPVRDALLRQDTHNMAQAYQIKPKQMVILFLGGSLGALQINTLVSAIGMQIIESLSAVIIHQTGHHTAPNAALTAHAHYIVQPFFEKELPYILQRADLVISRAGAGALWEFAALGKAVLLIPLPKSSSRGDQITNAQFFSNNDAAVVLHNPGAEALYVHIAQLLRAPQQRMAMGKRAHALYDTRAAQTLQHIISTELQQA